VVAIQPAVLSLRPICAYPAAPVRSEICFAYFRSCAHVVGGLFGSRPAFLKRARL
jgi:hypothetical protein